MSTLAEAISALNVLQGYFALQQPVTPIPVATFPGHEVTEDPPFSVSTRATVFGLNWNGSNDTGDLDPSEPDGNSRGFFIDPATGTNYVTHSVDLMGCSLPREVMLSTFLGVDSWQAHGITQVWKEYASDLLDWVKSNGPALDIDSGGKYTILSVPLVDAGPSANTHNGLDLTYKAAHALSTFGSATCTYRVMLKGKAQTIKGWDWTLKRVIGS